MADKDLDKFSRLPVLFWWEWPREDWATLVTNLEIEFPWRKALTWSAGFAVIVIFLGMHGSWRRGESLGPTPTTLIVFLAFFAMVLLASWLIFYSRKDMGLHPRIGDKPVAIVTAEGVRLGNEVLWFFSIRGNLTRVKAIEHPIIGPAVVLTMLPPNQLNIEFEILLPVPNSQPEMAARVAQTLAQQLGNESAAVSIGANPGPLTIPGPQRQKLAAAVIMVLCSTFLAFWSWNITMLWRQGMTAEGRVVGKRTAGQPPTHWIEYAFEPAPGQKLTNETKWTEEEYAHLNVGDKLSIRYLKQDPTVSEPSSKLTNARIITFGLFLAAALWATIHHVRAAL